MKADKYTTIGGDKRTFGATNWTAIEAIGSNDDVDSKAMVGNLLKTYWKPVYCYLRHKGYNNEKAKDLTQSFFHEVVLGRELIQRADRTKGRFRTLLLRALDRYLISIHRKETAQKRMPQDRLISLEDSTFGDLPEATCTLDSEEVFHYTWVCELLDRMLEEVEVECCQSGMAVHWEMFNDRVLLPILSSAEPLSIEELCSKYGIDKTTKVSTMIFAVKRRFQVTAKRLLRESVVSEHDIDEEKLELMKFLAKGQ